MTLFVQDADFTLYVGDALEVLRELPDESVHMCCTSPPYWGLRNYDCEGQLGLEATTGEYVAAIVAVFREVRRVLRSDGTLWLNLGSSYATGTDADRNPTSTEGADVPASWAGRSQPIRRHPSGFKPKDMVPIPWMVAMALQQDGWYLRSDIIWSKPNPMPESVTDRPTKAHEYVFLLSKSARYFFDQEAVRERYSEVGREWWNEPATTPGNPDRKDGGGVTSRPARGPDGRSVTRVAGADGSIQHRDGERWPNGGRNIRSVWEIATQPYPDAHFATFPEALPELCIKAGSSERGCCPECGAPWERMTATRRWAAVAPSGNREIGRWLGGESDLDGRAETETLGWRPFCEHDLPPVPCTVLDPFMGSGTTALVARKLGRRSVGIELNPEYARLAADRLKQLSLFAEASA